MSDIVVKINSVLNKMRDTFCIACGSRRRKDFLRKNKISDSDWLYSLSADDVINQRIPSHVVGPFARAKLFCKYAMNENLDCMVVVAANSDDISSANDGLSGAINGHVLIATNIDGVLRAFDPAHRPLRFVPGEIKVGANIQSVRTLYMYKITAIISPNEYMKVCSYSDFYHLYTKKTGTKS